jgi:2-(1,2-epoxy-1,2-dihydrophenyl)acetyl-CoA isomerase
MNDATPAAPILVEQRDGYRIITLNRPERLNALDRPTHEVLMAALVAAEADPSCRALVLTGAGRGFCAGADLSGRGSGVGESKESGRDSGNSIEETWNPLARKLFRLRMPTICAVNGIAAGAGSSIALGCDIVVAARSAKFLQAFARIGLVPDCGGSFLLPNLAGQARARGMAMLAEPLPAETALAWGMIWNVVDDAALMDEACALAARLAAMPTKALVMIRRMMAAGAGQTLDQSLDMERDYQSIASRTDDHHEGVQAFLEKRPAVFTGR